MTGAQLKSAEQRMQQQWHDLVMAEQAGKPLDILEQMYDSYILLAEEYTAYLQIYQCQRQHWHTTDSAHRPSNSAGSRQNQQQDAKLAS